MNRMENVKVGDLLVYRAEWPYTTSTVVVARVVKTTSSHVVAEVISSGGIIRVNKVTGKEVGGHSYWLPLAR